MKKVLYVLSLLIIASMMIVAACGSASPTAAVTPVPATEVMALATTATPFQPISTAIPNIVTATSSPTAPVRATDAVGGNIIVIAGEHPSILIMDENGSWWACPVAQCQSGILTDGSVGRPNGVLKVLLFDSTANQQYKLIRAELGILQLKLLSSSSIAVCKNPCNGPNITFNPIAVSELLKSEDFKNSAEGIEIQGLIDASEASGLCVKAGATEIDIMIYCKRK